MVSCNDQVEWEGDNYIKFNGQLLTPSVPETRGPVKDDAITFEEFQELDNKSFTFYVDMVTDETRYFGTYIVPIDHKGILQSYGEGMAPLQWKSKDKDHTFYAWTMPWVENDPYFTETDKYRDDEETIIFFNNNELENPMYGSLEKFVGAGIGPVSYNRNGEYVNLEFRHLVSKIEIGTLRFSYINATTGSPDYINITSGTITFTNMPSEGIFIRENEEEGKPVPIVKAKAGSNEVTYNLGSNNILYVCPLTDLSKVEFRINTESTTSIETSGEFLGSLSSLVLKRDPADWWVIMQQEEHPDTEPNTTLYEGEVLKLNIVLRRGRGTYVSGEIKAWDDQPMRDGTAYPNPGIYNGSEWKAFYDTFKEGYTDEEEERMFDIYGHEDKETNTKEYRLYSDLDDISNTFRFSRKYVMNGMGHTVTFSGLHSTTNGPEVGITMVKDIFLSDGKGHTLYIDEDFNIYIVNADGTMKQTQYQLPEDGLTGSQKKFVINLETGSFRTSTSV